MNEIGLRAGCQRLPIHLACKGGYLDIVKVLLSHNPQYQVVQKDDDNNMPIHLACQQGGVNIVHLLLQYTPKQQVLHWGKGDQRPIHHACRQSLPDLLVVLLEHYAEEQVIQLQSPLLLLCHHSNPAEKVEVILQYFPEKQVMISTQLGILPIHLACQKQEVRTVELLLEHIPDQQVLAKVEGNGPLHVACNVGNIDIVKLLLRHIPEQQVLQYSRDYQFPVHVPLHNAWRWNSLPIILLLLPFDMQSQMKQLPETSQSAMRTRFLEDDEWRSGLISLFVEGLLREDDLDFWPDGEDRQRLLREIIRRRTTKSARSA